MKLALYQMQVSDGMEANLAKSLGAIEEGASLILIPTVNTVSEP